MPGSSRMNRRDRTPSVSAATTGGTTGGTTTGSLEKAKNRSIREKKTVSEKRKKINKSKENSKKGNSKRGGNSQKKKKTAAGGVKKSREDLKQPPSKKPSSEQANPPPPPAPKKPQPKEENLKKMADRVKKKIDEKEKKKEENVKAPKTKAGDDAFPKYKVLKTVEDVSKYSQVVDIGLQPSVKINAKSYLARAKAKATKNNTNGGQLFVMDPVSGKERPFWIQDQMYQPPLSEDDFILNSETTYDVLKGKVQLAQEAPEWTKVFDPLEKLSTLQEKDEAAFKNPVIFRNSVRSMIDVAEPASPDGMKEEKCDYEPQDLQFKEPRMARVYNPKNRADMILVPFQPGQYRLDENGELVKTEQ